MGKELGQRLAALIKERRLTQKEVAQEAGITEAAMSHYIKGDREPRASVMAKIAETLHTTSDFLANGTAPNARAEIDLARKLIARNVSEMSRAEKMQIIDILFEKE